MYAIIINTAQHADAAQQQRYAILSGTIWGLQAEAGRPFGSVADACGLTGRKKVRVNSQVLLV